MPDSSAHFMYFLGRRYMRWNNSDNPQHMVYAEEPHDGAFVAFPKLYTSIQYWYKYTITFTVNGTVDSTAQYLPGETITYPSVEYNPQDTFYWDTHPAVMPENNITVNATLILSTKTISLYFLGNLVRSLTLHYEDAIPASFWQDIPQPDGYGNTLTYAWRPLENTNWQSGTLQTMPDYDVYATVSRDILSYTLSFVYDGTTVKSATVQYNSGSRISSYAPEPEEFGEHSTKIENNHKYKFAWNYGDEDPNASMPPRNVTVTGYYEQVAECVVTVTFSSNEDSSQGFDPDLRGTVILYGTYFAGDDFPEDDVRTVLNNTELDYRYRWVLPLLPKVPDQATYNVSIYTVIREEYTVVYRIHVIINGSEYIPAQGTNEYTEWESQTRKYYGDSVNFTFLPTGISPDSGYEWYCMDTAQFTMP
jgi:hypothetical protein